MRRKRSVKVEIFITVCAAIVLLTGALPLINKENDAQLIAAIFGAIALGVSLSNLIRHVREKQRESEVRDE
jgi:hypothetical protein